MCSKATLLPTQECFPPLLDDTTETLFAAQKRYRYVAPECFSMHPPAFNKPQEVYSLSWMIYKLLESLFWLKDLKLKVKDVYFSL